ncbi:hypothetical protein SASPL_154525 [Salvia splendens]|uniref:Uncharacterized protein n=1 Tax=Salvia splendens TaxID=180675 RepID=A0A8X8W0C4_SALSN|nr:hypothetical protein SASPL_154525 [Salvia splendens]
MLGALEFYTCEPDSYPRPFNFQLWVMSDGSWTRESVFHIRRIREPLLFSEDGKLLYLTFLGEYEQELVVFDRASGKLKHLGIASHVDDPAMFPFVESFVQLNGISSIEELLDTNSSFTQIREVSHEAEDIIESHMVHHMLSGSAAMLKPTEMEDKKKLPELDSFMEQVKLVEMEDKKMLSSTSSTSVVVGIDEDLMQLKDRLIAISLQQLVDKSSLTKIDSEIREVAHQAEDIIESHMVHHMLSGSNCVRFTLSTRDLDSVIEQAVKLVEMEDKKMP